MDNKLKFSLVFLLILSLIFNLILMFSLSYNNSGWEYYSSQNSIQWCELSNDQSEIINDLIIELQYYDDFY